MNNRCQRQQTKDKNKKKNKNKTMKNYRKICKQKPEKTKRKKFLLLKFLFKINFTLTLYICLIWFNRGNNIICLLLLLLLLLIFVADVDAVGCIRKLKNDAGKHWVKYCCLYTRSLLDFVSLIKLYCTTLHCTPLRTCG